MDCSDKKGGTAAMTAEIGPLEEQDDHPESSSGCVAAVEYYKKHNVELGQVLSQSLPLRFIRCNPRYLSPETLDRLQTELGGIQPVPVPWLEGYFALPGDVGINATKVYQEGRIYGQDVSSGAAVAALMEMSKNSRQKPTCPSLRILEICTAPGLKLCAIADFLRQHSTDPSSAHVVVGVELSETRMSTCKQIVRKYQLGTSNDMDGSKSNNVRIRLYQNDGTKFGEEPLNLAFDSFVANEQRILAGTKRKRLNKSGRAREQMMLLQTAHLDRRQDGGGTTTGVGDEICLEPFDLVLVDAECSNDGSLVHVQKRCEKILAADVASAAIPLATCKESVKELVLLQRQLLERGFALLRPGGFVVYSTCSLDQDQNEGVVQWFLQNHAQDAEVSKIAFGVDDPLVQQSDSLGSVRFLPNTDAGALATKRLFGSGFFVARIRKL
jgi:16S rRNA C967 or C1407 C5-methylase (RsmB/RsmF family)